MMRKPRDVAQSFRLDFRFEWLSLGIGGAGEEKILPHQNPLLIADIVKLVRFVNPAAPDAQHVHVGIQSRLNTLLVTLARAGAIEEAIVGDPIEAFAEDRLAIDLQRKSAADVVGMGVEFDRAEADA